uniref:Uncharacterized protein n=1 Tax=Zea mays TaxID=4577 RepID=C4J6T7_MAIZE|nr:unknown [Zea mays]
MGACRGASTPRAGRRSPRERLWRARPALSATRCRRTCPWRRRGARSRGSRTRRPCRRRA